MCRLVVEPVRKTFFTNNDGQMRGVAACPHRAVACRMLKLRLTYKMSTAAKILVADDSLTIRKLVERVLCQEGYEVITAETGAGCLEQAALHKPHLILLDYILPDMQGTEICRSLINSPDTWEIPVLMMSSNGNAIRQLYHDLNNVADYLTKPFAPSVLSAVVSHLLQKDSLTQMGEAAPAEGGNGAAAAATAAEAAVPSEFMDKVERLIHLMENGPAPAAPTAEAKPVEAAPAKPKAPRKRKPVAAAPATETLQRKFRLAVQKFLRSRIQQIPEWEAARAGENPEEFYLGRLLSKDGIRELSAELIKITGAPPDATGGMRCPASLAPLDSVLRHLHDNRLTGELRLETGEETILAFLNQGETVFITTNHPRNYCAGAVCDFQAVSHAAIGEAVRAQEEQSIPFFISLDDAGQLPPDASLESLLNIQGQQCLARAFKSPALEVSFHPLKKLPAIAKQHACEIPLTQLLIVCYRMVDDWFTLEKVFPEMDAALAPTSEMEARLRDLALDASEAKVIAGMRGGLTASQLAAIVEMPTYELCRVLYRFIKLGMVSVGQPRVEEEADPAVAAPSAAAEAAVVAAEASGASAPSEEVSDEAPASDMAATELEVAPVSEVPSVPPVIPVAEAAELAASAAEMVASNPPAPEFSEVVPVAELPAAAPVLTAAALAPIAGPMGEFSPAQESPAPAVTAAPMAEAPLSTDCPAGEMLNQTPNLAAAPLPVTRAGEPDLTGLNSGACGCCTPAAQPGSEPVVTTENHIS